jgi:predicted ATP-grasp superfamily ATP-dependent carboligase
MRALVVQGYYRSQGALATARGLAAAGWEVGVASAYPHDLAGASRVVARRHLVPSEDLDPDGFLAEALRVADGYDVVVPCGDPDVLALSEARDRTSAVVPYGSHQSVVDCFDKELMATHADAVGVLVPRTVVATPEAIESFPLPFVVKGARYWLPNRPPGDRRFTADVFTDRDQGRERAEAIRDFGGRPLVQQAITGALIGVAVVRHPSGRLLAQFQQRAQTLYPEPSGNAARAVSVPADPRLVAAVGAVLDRIGFAGLVQADFIEDERGDHWLIDLNGRVYNSIGLAIASGVNLPALWAGSATGWVDGDAPLVTGRPGVRYQNLVNDLRRAGRDWGEVAAALAAAPVSVHSVWSPRDPAPALRYARDLGGRVGVRVQRLRDRWRTR